MLRLTDVTARYGSIEALHGISLVVPRGKVVALLGANGAGKSTTMRAIAGLVAVRSGSIEFDGKRIDRLPTHKIFRKGIALVPQGRELFPDMTVAENLELGGQYLASKGDRLSLLQEMFDLFPRLHERKQQRAGTLSGGERAMLAAARAIMSRPSVLLLDEPSAGLAPLVVKELGRALLKLNRSGQTILLVEQNIRLALEISDYVSVIQNGRIVASNEASHFIDNDEIFRSYFG